MMNYTLLTTRILSADDVVYFCVNLAAALLVLASLPGAFNVATLVIQVFFVVVSLCGIVLRLRRKLALGARGPDSAAMSPHPAAPAATAPSSAVPLAAAPRAAVPAA